MGYDRSDSFPFGFEPNGDLFGLKFKGKLSPLSYPIQFERKCNASFLSVPDDTGSQSEKISFRDIPIENPP